MSIAAFHDLAALVDIPADGTISRTIYQDSAIKAVLFGFAAGQELSEHTSAMAATLQFVSGNAQVTLNGEQIEAGPGTWIHLPPRLPHSVVALTPVVMLLLLMKRTV
ncbi:MAG TPA: cupin domain-containing protein [Roseiflexaceae bacterium]|nr:cupin domain-containing protein [Roseiflexaceae bacterium]HMP41480.1 cupin domain-containing protein [Roseiflexaceae bacterium]